MKRDLAVPNELEYWPFNTRGGAVLIHRPVKRPGARRWARRGGLRAPHQRQAMKPEDSHILDTVIAVVTRYGMNRTTMADIAHASGVSRQTLYGRYEDKDGIMAAAIDLIADRVCRELRMEFAQETELGKKFDAYFRVGVWPIYEIMQAMPDAADFEKGIGPASIAAIRRAGEAKETILAELLRSRLPADAPSAEQVARFFEQTSCQAKMSGMAREELHQFLSVLKASVLALVRNP